MMPNLRAAITQVTRGGRCRNFSSYGNKNEIEYIGGSVSAKLMGFCTCSVIGYAAFGYQGTKILVGLMNDLGEHSDKMRKESNKERMRLIQIQRSRKNLHLQNQKN